MWECPDFFPLDGSYVLLTSPQEMQAEGTEFIDGNTTLCLIGQFDRERARLLRQHEQTIDYGLDFYAPQTVLTEDGRRVMIAWMQYWNSVDFRPAQNLPFFGQMTAPRELRVQDGKLIQNPVRELDRYRGRAVRSQKGLQCYLCLCPLEKQLEKSECFDERSTHHSRNSHKK
jgi:beta-fructofuranosidase